jgi:hypothetical protein
MSAIYNIVVTVMDSTVVQIIFAIWTGVWLVQLLRGSQSVATTVFAAMGLAFVVTLFIIPSSSTS